MPKYNSSRPYTLTVWETVKAWEAFQEALQEEAFRLSLPQNHPLHDSPEFVVKLAVNHVWACARIYQHPEQHFTLKEGTP